LAPPAQARSSGASTQFWLKVLVIAMGLLIVAGVVVIAAELGRRVFSANTARPPAGTAFAERIALPSGAQVLSVNPVGERLAVHVETPDGLSRVYMVDPRNGALLGTIDFPPGPAR